jgi:5-methyltetrahydropteroyltriglutamate--homocysteine methyltransferase
MHQSVDRILTSHVGSLPRGDELGDMLIENEAGRSLDNTRLDELIESRVAHVLAKQREAGVDIANDGEQGRVGFQTYVPQRMSGFGGASKRPYAKEFIEFPLFTKKMLSRIPRSGKVFDAPEAVGELRWHDTADCRRHWPPQAAGRLKRLAAQVDPPFTEYFMTEPSPGIIATTMLNAYYPSHEAYLDAIAREMAHEYRAVVDAGFVLQIGPGGASRARHRGYAGLPSCPSRHAAVPGRGECQLVPC